MVLNGPAYLSLVLMFIGLISLIVGVTLYEVYVDTKESRSAWIWSLIIGGAILAFAASIFSIIILNASEPSGPDPNLRPNDY